MEKDKPEFARAVAHYSDEELQMLKEQLTAPSILCPTNRQISSLCIDYQCTSETCFFCEDEHCPPCRKAHSQCYSNVRLDKFVSLVQTQTRNYRLFLSELLEQESLLIERIKQESMDLVERFRWMGLTGKLQQVIHQMFVSRDPRVEFNSKVAVELLKKLRGFGDFNREKGNKLIDLFKEETQKIGDHLKNMKKSLIIDLYSKSEVRKEQKQKEPKCLLNKSVASSKTETLLNSISCSSNILQSPKDIEFVLEALDHPQTLKKLFVASSDGFSAHKFHQICDGIADTLTVIRTSFGKTIAGYTPIKWSSPTDSTWFPDTSNRSFLLSVDLREKMTLVDPLKAIQCSISWGPCFGGGCDIAIADKCDVKDSSSLFPTSYNLKGKYKNQASTWTAFTGATHFWNFKVHQYEVYKVEWDN